MPHNATRSVAANVRAEMARAGVSARHLADEMGVNRGWVHRRASGETPCTVEDLALLATHLGVPISRLYGPDHELEGRAS